MNYAEAEKLLAAVVDRLRRERERRGLSKKKIAAMSGISRTAIVMIESGQRSPSLMICLRLADALGLRLDNVLRGAYRSRGRK
jgi:XRE family aerobic/anaerobic benzoate catabolism transcriptional regulator